MGVPHGHGNLRSSPYGFVPASVQALYRKSLALFESMDYSQALDLALAQCPGPWMNTQMGGKWMLVSVSSY